MLGKSSITYANDLRPRFKKKGGKGASGVEGGSAIIKEAAVAFLMLGFVLYR